MFRSSSLRHVGRFALAGLAVLLLWTCESRAQAPGENRKVHVLLMGLTDDASLGPGMETNLRSLKRLLETGLPASRRGPLQIVKGRDIAAQNILANVDRLTNGPDDTVFCYYSGHGAYDPDRAENDPSGGHHFQIPGGDLMRKELWARLRARNARLTVLLTDTCNVKSSANLGHKGKFSHRIVLENPLLHSLLLTQQGVVDISGSSKDQFGWTNAQTGGWFTLAFTQTVEQKLFPNSRQTTWARFMEKVSDRTSQIFQDGKKNALADPGFANSPWFALLRDQQDLRPQRFDQRSLWIHPKGRFEKTDGGAWRETNPENVILNFRETQRTGDFVELLDESRNLYVRLDDERCHWSTGDGWNFIYQGSWR